MKKFFANIKSKLASMKNNAVISAKTALASTSGEGYIDTGVKIIIGVVIGGVILAGLYALFNTTIFPTLPQKLSGLFDYKGKTPTAGDGFPSPHNLKKKGVRMMILPPVTPVMPIDPTRVYELVSANTEAVKAVLFLLGFIAFAIVSSVLTVRYLAKAKTGLYSEIGGSIAMSVAVLLFIRYGASLVALQGLLLYDLLLYASVSDIRTRKAEDWAWIAMIPLALCSIPRIGILSMLLGAGIVFLPQLAMAVLPPHKTLGGADIKLSTASAFLLGAVRGVGGYLVGLLASVIFTLIYNKAKGRSNKNSYPLIPFLAVGVMAAFFI